MRWNQIIEHLWRYKRFWWFCAALVLLNGLFFMFYGAGETQRIAELQKRYKLERQKVSELRKSQARAQRYALDAAALDTFMGNLDPKIMFPERIKALERLFKSHGLNPAAMTFKSEALPDQSLVRFVSSLQLTGPYPALKSVLNGLQTLPGLFCIDKLSIENTADGQSLTMALEISAYFRDPGGESSSS